MLKFVGKFALIILCNLFAFLLIGHTLDLLLQTKNSFKIVFLFLSIVSLTIISSFYIKNFLKQLEKLNNTKNDE